MSVWPSYPTVYEIDTRVRLSSLSEESGTPIDLGGINGGIWQRTAVGEKGHDIFVLPIGFAKLAARVGKPVGSIEVRIDPGQVTLAYS